MNDDERGEFREQEMADELTRLRADIKKLEDLYRGASERETRYAQESHRLRAEVDAYKADAERYRYLKVRNPEDVFAGRGPGAGVWCDMENEMGTLVLVTGDDLDAEVDAARAALKEPT